MAGLLAAGFLCAQGRMDPILCALCATFGNVLGSSLLFYLAKYSRKDFAPFLRKHRRKIALGVLLFRKNWLLFIFAQKYIYGVKTVIPIAAGLARFDSAKFLFFNALACILWTALILPAAYFASEALLSFFSSFSRPYLAPLFFIAVIFGIYWYLKRFSVKNAKK